MCIRDRYRADPQSARGSRLTYRLPSRNRSTKRGFSVLKPETWEFLKRAGTLVGLCGAAIAFAWFCFTTVSRVGVLENQMQALVITGAKSTASPTAPVGVPPMQFGTAARPAGDSVIGVNPIAQLCADFAKQLAAKQAIAALDPILTAMDRINCKDLKN